MGRGKSPWSCLPPCPAGDERPRDGRGGYIHAAHPPPGGAAATIYAEVFKVTLDTREAKHPQPLAEAAAGLGGPSISIALPQSSNETFRGFTNDAVMLCVLTVVGRQKAYSTQYLYTELFAGPSRLPLPGKFYAEVLCLAFLVYDGQEESPMAQYEPFRYTFVNDPTCVPQLRFANVSDTGADHHRRETDRHWRRGGRTWSRLPRFRAGKLRRERDRES